MNRSEFVSMFNRNRKRHRQQILNRLGYHKKSREICHQDSSWVDNLIDKINDDDFLDEIFVQNLLVGSLFYLKTYVLKNNQWTELIYNHSDIRSCVVGVEKFRFFTFLEMIEFDAKTGKIDVYEINKERFSKLFKNNFDFILNREKVIDSQLYDRVDRDTVVQIFYRTFRLKKSNTRKYGDSDYNLSSLIKQMFDVDLDHYLNNFGVSHKSNLYCRLIYKVICESLLENHNLEIRHLSIITKTTEYGYYFAIKESRMLIELKKIGIDGFKKFNEQYQKMGRLLIFKNVHPFYWNIKNRMSDTQLINLYHSNSNFFVEPSDLNALFLEYAFSHKKRTDYYSYDSLKRFFNERHVFPFEQKAANWLKHLYYLYGKPIGYFLSLAPFQLRELLFIKGFPKGKQLVAYFKKEKQSEQMVLSLIHSSGKALDCLLKSGNFDKTTQVCDLLNKKMKSGKISAELYSFGFNEPEVNRNNRIRVI